MKKLITGLLIVCMLCAAAAVIPSAAGSASKAPEAYRALHALTAEQQSVADRLLKVTDSAPEVSNEPVIAEHEDKGITLWFDHSYYNTPAEEIKSNGRNTYQIRLAKNETEGCHLLLASDRDIDGLTLKVSSFKNADGKKLEKEVFYGYYFEDVDGKTVADPIPALDSDTQFSLTKNKSKMIIIKVKSKADTPAGLYSATVKLRDKDENVIKQANVYAYVWNFTLPVASYCKTLSDLNEWAVIVGGNRENTTQDGLEDDLYAIYYEYLLDNKVNCYTLPYAKRGQLWDDRVDQYMDDPRCTAFTLFWKTACKNDADIPAYVEAAYNRLAKNPDRFEKAYFYPDKCDEPLTVATLNLIKKYNTEFKKFFGDKTKLIIPIHYNTNINTSADFFKYLENDVNVWCPKTYFFNTSEDKSAYSKLFNQYYNKSMETKYGKFADRMAEQQAGGDEVWWYVTRYPHNPEITFSINDESVKHRILFWQSKLYNIDGVLYYMCNDWENSKVWTKKYEHAVSGTVVDTYGNGVLIYPGAALSEYVDKYGTDGYPVGSLRLESIRDGVEDYDYFTLLDQKFGEGTSDLMIKQITTALGDYSTDTELFAKVRTAVGNLLEDKAGDVNRDGRVNNKDVVYLFRSVTNPQYAKDKNAADCNGDGKITNEDVVLLFRYVSGDDVVMYYGKQ